MGARPHASGASFLAPGASPGRIAITGDYTPSTTTVTDIELAGSEPGTGYDQVVVANTARFAGSLRVTLADGFIPNPCQTFHVVTYAARTGTFSNATTPIDVGGGIKLRQVYAATGLVLVAYSANGPNVHPTQVSVSVDGVTDTYDVCIGAGADVITVSPDDQVTVDKPTLTFGGSQLPQTVTVSASPGASRDVGLITHTATSGTPVANVTVLISGAVPSDTDPPTTSAVASPGPNEHGWNRTDVSIQLSATDAGSGVAEIVWELTGAQTGSASVPGSATSVTVTAEGNTRLTYFARDAAGNQESPKTLDLRIDKTAPTVTATPSPLPNADGWNNTDVTVTYTATDAMSGIAGDATATQLFSAEGANQSGSHTFADMADNVGTGSVTGINIDKTAPALACSADPSQLWPPNGKMLRVTVSLDGADGLSGVASFALRSATSNEQNTGPGPDIQDFTVGAPDTDGSLRAARNGSGNGRVYSLIYDAQDRAGNRGECVARVTVPHDQRGH